MQLDETSTQLAEVSNTVHQAMPSETQNLNAGTWWRLTGAFNDLQDRESHSHGLIFLMTDVIVIDGDIHTVILNEHPKFGGGKFKVLLDDLLLNFTHDRAGEDLRKIELDALMDDIRQITKEISAPPDDQTLMLSLVNSGFNNQRRSSQPNVGLVPAVLLPGGDIDAVESKIETAIAVMQSRQAWVMERTEKMQSSMRLVARYQSEKVALGLAGISEQSKQANTLLTNVKTMRLWLGDDQTFNTLVQGTGAARSAPLHFMQRMLYLDEEIYTHKRLDGLNGDDLNDLSVILNENPELVERMLPHPRCVVITKARRNTRPFDLPDDMKSISAMMDGIEADNQIQILVRNGDEVHLIATDEITSKASRLFPSKSEIDKIFVTKDLGGRTITPHDIEYSDKRADHDARALFYKRILLILWGLTERENILGDFSAKGANWFEETLHNEAFRFVHDEEAVLGDGRLGVTEFLSNNRSKMRPGSRVIVLWKKAVTEDTAPQIYEGRHNYRFRSVDFEEESACLIVEASGTDCTVKCPVTKYSYAKGEDRAFQTKVRLSRKDRRSGRYHADGFLCLEGVRSEDLKYYFDSRIHREHYLRYTHLFNHAMTILEAEEKHCDPILRALCDTAKTSKDIATQAMTLWRGGAKGALPDPVTDMPKLVVLSGLIEDILNRPQQDALFMDLSPSGLLEVGKLIEINVLETDCPFVEITSYGMTKKSGWVEKSRKISSIDDMPIMNRIRIHNTVSRSVMDHVRSIPEVLQDISNVEAIRITPIDFKAGTGPILGLINTYDEMDVKALAGHCRKWARANSMKQVVVPDLKTTLGYIIDSKGNHNNNVFRIELYVDPLMQMMHQGDSDFVDHFVNDLYKNKIFGMQDFKDTLAKQIDQDQKPYGIRMSPIEQSKIAKDIFKGACPLGEKTHVLRCLSHQSFVDTKMLFPKSLREAALRYIHSKRYGSQPFEDEKLVQRIDDLKIQLFEGAEDVIYDLTGFHADHIESQDQSQDFGVEP